MSEMSPDEKIRIECLQMAGGDVPKAAAMYQWVVELRRGGKRDPEQFHTSKTDDKAVRRKLMERFT